MILTRKDCHKTGTEKVDQCSGWLRTTLEAPAEDTNQPQSSPSGKNDRQEGETFVSLNFHEYRDKGPRGAAPTSDMEIRDSGWAGDDLKTAIHIELLDHHDGKRTDRPRGEFFEGS
ncbi:hypothetical protein E2C01_002541 [Portunus trituberculatus]|uniref:Uncharacterized protein n=1 Tax=Portunus trituberculatus TaxID=210409 RepID=A0A5B7CMB2_PORTR|nr:hypothetical protein [Portunus trituberculatus]